MPDIGYDLSPEGEPLCRAYHEEQPTMPAGYMTRRQLLGRALAISAGALVGSRLGFEALGVAETVYAEKRWAPNEAHFDLVPGAEQLGTGGDLYLASPGFAQPDSVTPARELYDAMNGSVKVASFTKPNQGYTLESIVPAMQAIIEREQPERVYMWCISMGDVFMFEAATAIVQSSMQRSSKSTPLVIPEIPLLSSPSDRFDAFQDNPVIEQIVQALESAGYDGDINGKFAFDLNDQLRNDPHVSEGIIGLGKMLVNALREVNDHCSPAIGWSDMKLLYPFNVREQAQRYRILSERAAVSINGKVLEPNDVDNASLPKTKLVYITTPSDRIVRADQALDKFTQSTPILGMDLVSIENNVPDFDDHANSYGGALTYAAWKNAQTAKA